MRQYDVYFGNFDFPDDTGWKDRPTAIIEVFDDSETVTILGIYSYKKWFDNFPERYNELYEIKDKAEAGLDLSRKSFIDIVDANDVAKSTVDYFQYKGHLSDRDINGLLDKMEEYYGNV